MAQVVLEAHVMTPTSPILVLVGLLATPPMACDGAGNPAKAATSVAGTAAAPASPASATGSVARPPAAAPAGSAAAAAAGTPARASSGSGGSTAHYVCCASGKGMDLVEPGECHEDLGDVILLTSQCLDESIGSSPTDAELAARVCCHRGDTTPSYTTAATCAAEGEVIDAARCDDVEWGVVPVEADGAALAAYEGEFVRGATRWFDAVSRERALPTGEDDLVTLLLSSDTAACAANRGDREYDQIEHRGNQAFDEASVACIPKVKVPLSASGAWKNGWRCARHGLARAAGKRAFDQVRAEAVEFTGNSGGAMRCFETVDPEQRHVSVFLAFSGDGRKIRFGAFDRAPKSMAQSR